MKFPINVNAVTVWEKTVVNRAPAYVRHELGACYWQEISGQTDAREPESRLFLAIPESSVTYLPKEEDRLVSGSVPDESPPNSAMTVMQVKDFRYLLPGMMHVEVTAK